MDVTALNFPVICFERGFVSIRRDWDKLTTTTTAGLRNGMYRDLLVVDSSGRSLRVKDARRVQGIGPFWGFNIFLNQRIRVELLTEGDLHQVTTDDVKSRVLKSFQEWKGWSSSDRFDELRERTSSARSIPEIIQILSDIGGLEKEFNT